MQSSLSHINHDRFLFVLLFLLTSGLAHAEGSGLAIVAPQDKIEDSSIIMKKGAPDVFLPDYEIVSGNQDITGDLSGDIKEAYAAWKSACADWKTEMKELNHGNLISISCGSPKMSDNSNGLRHYQSNGLYKTRVKIKERK